MNCFSVEFWEFLKRFYLFIFSQRGREEERGRNINVWLLFTCPPLGTWPTTQPCALTGNRTSDPLVRSLVLNPLSHTSQGLRILGISYIAVFCRICGFANIFPKSVVCLFILLMETFMEQKFVVFLMKSNLPIYFTFLLWIKLSVKFKNSLLGPKISLPYVFFWNFYTFTFIFSFF